MKVEFQVPALVAAGRTGHPGLMPLSGPSNEHQRAAVVKVYEDGPYLLRGNFEVQDHDGEPIASRRRTVALCRCGRSKLRPYCDGTHRTVRFRASGKLEGLPMEGRDGTLESVASGRVVDEPGQTFLAVACAHHRVREDAADFSRDALRHAEPLLSAAEALLRWQLKLDGAVIDAPAHDEARGLSPLDAVRSARVSAVGLVLRDSTVADQVRSLLRDAARALQTASPSATADTA